MKWAKRFGLVLIISVIGYFLFLHAGMSSDQDTVLKWYYKLEMIIAGIFWWPAYIYLELRELLGYKTNILGFELWVFQLLGYAAVFKIYDLFKKT
ncbi:hypothetical protein GCM10009133_20570 [Cocleimonas flava]|uniref:Uncharacterized protein n=1 Tax=Cocleimonas flava TaxID=634765 RepID=A0A4R1ERT2_9GAMM|nr:hypothetical protein [Cocleimonas flava]TCJ82592.1 hypothetical protein EV695_3323 [Cocleimonas flava]